MRLSVLNTGAVLGALLFLCASIAAGAPGGWQSFPNARLAAGDFADGDSFPVEIQRDGKSETIIARLYFVDCPETIGDTESDRKRVLEQMRYFGQPSPAEVLEAGRNAREFTAKALAAPFTLETAFAAAPGRSRTTRFYALVRLANGRDLGGELVSAGLARSRGTGRALPDGRTAADHEKHLMDLEASAMLARRGIWKTADPEKLAALREQEREEARQLASMFTTPTPAKNTPSETRADSTPAAPSELINLNTASSAQLQKLPGIGKALAASIIDRRPYASVDDLQQNPKIPVRVFEQIRTMVTVGDGTP